MFFFKKTNLYLIAACFLFGSSLWSLHSPQRFFSTQDSSWLDCDFYEEVFKDDWDALSIKERRAVLSDYIKKELSFVAAEKIGLFLNPLIKQKLESRRYFLLINNAYEHFIARPLIDSLDYVLNKKNLQYRAETYHLLIGFEGSSQDTESLISKERAFFLADSLLFEINRAVVAGESVVAAFTARAVVFSIDPSVKQNLGYLGWVPWGQTVMRFQKPLFDSEENVVFGPVLTEYGYHLILKTHQAHSNYYYYSQENYNDLSYKVSLRTLVLDSLRSASAFFDSSLIKDSGFQINRPSFLALVSLLTKKEDSNRRATSKNSLVQKLLRAQDGFGVLFVANKEGFGLGWMINKIQKTPPSRIPRIKNKEDLMSLLQTLLLQELVSNLAYKNGVHLSSSFKRDLKTNYKNIIYNEYVSFLLNSSKKPDSSAVFQKYENSVLNGMLLTPPRVVFSEIRVFDESVALLLQNRIMEGELFDDLLLEYGGSVKKPLTRGKNNPLMEAAFSLSVGETSSLIYNKRSFSILRVEAFLDSEPVLFEGVYSQLERELVLIKQEVIKDSLFVSLLQKYPVVVDSSVVGF